MKKFLSVLFSLLFFLPFVGEAQNLVPNPSFEDTVACPDNLDQVYKAVGWSSTRPSPDYFHACSSPSSFQSVSVPSNYFGYEMAASGNAYTGFAAKNGQFSVREYLGAQLISPLQIGTEYFISFKVSLSYTSFMTVCGVNKLGILFSTIPYTVSNPAPICNCAQFYSDSVITDTINWKSIKGSFIADSNYSYLNIGNFFNDSETDSVQIQGSQCVAYYYLDDICVSEDSSFCYNYVYTGVPSQYAEDVIYVYPNPSTDWIEIKRNEIRTVLIHDAFGKAVYFNSRFIAPQKIDVSSFTRGIYFVKAETKNATIIQKIILI